MEHLPVGDNKYDIDRKSAAGKNRGSEQQGGAAAKWALWIVWGVVLIWMVVIFLFSAEDMDESAKKSNALFLFLEELFFEDGIAPESGGTMRFIVRKFGHLTEYFVLGCLVSNAWVVSLRKRGNMRVLRTAFCWSIAFCALYAVTDELHQLFVPGRFASAIDVGIDTIGSVLGIAALLLIWRTAGKEWL